MLPPGLHFATEVAALADEAVRVLQIAQPEPLRLLHRSLPVGPGLFGATPLFRGIERRSRRLHHIDRNKLPAISFGPSGLGFPSPSCPLHQEDSSWGARLTVLSCLARTG